MGKLFGPVDPSKPLASVAVQDAAAAATAILTNPSAHVGKTYNIVGPAYTHAQLAASLSSSVGKSVEYVQVPYEAASASFLEKGWPAWQVAGLVELFRAIDADTYSYPQGDFTAITGKAPTSIEQWVEQSKAGFGAVASAPRTKTVIVGASGFIGQATVGALAGAIGGDKVVVVSRNPSGSACEGFRSAGAAVVAGDLNDAASLSAPFADAAAVYLIAPGTEV
jgi:uncharacterized protein YbjT (DUF2867 family)